MSKNTGVPPQAGSGHSPKGGAASSTASPAQTSVPNAANPFERVKALTVAERDALIGPLSMEQYFELPERERYIQGIADCVGYWVKWTIREYEGDVTPDTHVWLNGYEGAPPHWPSVGQLLRWLLALRPASAIEAATDA